MEFVLVVVFHRVAHIGRVAILKPAPFVEQGSLGELIELFDLAEVDFLRDARTGSENA